MFDRTWYRHTAYVAHPVEVRFPKASNPWVCCIHNNQVTDAGTLWMTDWQSRTPPGIKIISSELIYQKAPDRDIWGIVSKATKEVEEARGSGEDLSLHDVVMKRITDSGPPEKSGLQAWERWDIYKVEVESLWPETLYDPDRDPGWKCVIM